MKKIESKGLLFLFPVGGSIMNYRKLLLELNDKVLCDGEDSERKLYIKKEALSSFAFFLLGEPLGV